MMLVQPVETISANVDSRLPAGYYFDNPLAQRPDEIVGLLQQVEMGWELNEQEWLSVREHIRQLGCQVLHTGVRNNRERLIGFGALVYTGTNGELGDFVVSPPDQHKGVGKAVLMEQLRQAEILGVTSLYVAIVEPTNTLVSFYIDQGFQATQKGELVRGPSPAPLVV